MSPDGFYSPNGVDKRIASLLPAIGAACDVGANNGESYSNTLHFEEKGWTVLCIEPNPTLAQYGRSKRKLWKQMGCSNTKGTAKFTQIGEYPYVSWSNINMEQAKVFLPQLIPNKRVEFQVPIDTLDSILTESGLTRLDFLNVDVEGHEWEVMQGFSIDTWKPKVMVIETWEVACPMVEKIKSHGYRLLDRLEFDNIFVL